MTSIIGSSLIKSANDKRKYRHLTLSNQLKVILIEDEETEKSSACIDVGVGSMSNPKDIHGLAHFLGITIIGIIIYSNYYHLSS